MDAEKLMRQAGMTAAEYFDEAIAAIDKRFGDGAARQNPQLVSAFMQAASDDFRTMWWGQQVGAALSDIADALGGKHQP